MLAGLLAHSSLSASATGSGNNVIPYKIDNKYYSAHVTIVTRELGQETSAEQGQADEYPVLVWLLPDTDDQVSQAAYCHIDP